MTENEYISSRLEDQINWYSKKSDTCQARFKSLRLIEIIAATFIPLLTGIGDKFPSGQWIIALLAVLIALVAAASSLFKYHENWILYRITSEQLKHEKYLYMTKSGPYAGTDGFNLLVERVEALISKESNSWAQITNRPVKAENGK
jgi:hypothetical protein